MTPSEMIKQIENGGLDNTLSLLYPQEAVSAQRTRLCGAITAFAQGFSENRDIRIFSAPGRTEIGGNHTDHQRGRVLAAAVDLDVLCIASPNGADVIRIHSDGYTPNEIGLDNLLPRADEKNTTGALIRGVARACRDRGYRVMGFDAYITSNVLKGSGLSSSAAFEVAVGAMISGMFNDGNIPPVEIAKMGQYAENEYFGKPSGLMDQMASAVGGCVAIDFADPENPVIETIDFDFSRSGYTICIVDTKGSHADLTHEYAAIPKEMLSVAALFGKTHLRDVNKDGFFARLPEVCEKCGDRAALRAMHFFADNGRVARQVHALTNDDFAAFLSLINESGRSSAICLQNIYSCATPQEQGLSIALALSETLLSRRNGAYRVHGGGFAGTIQAFVPSALAGEYAAAMEAVFGQDTCHRLSVRPVGAIEIM